MHIIKSNYSFIITLSLSIAWVIYILGYLTYVADISLASLNNQEEFPPIVSKDFLEYFKFILIGTASTKKGLLILYICRMCMFNFLVIFIASIYIMNKQRKEIKNLKRRIKEYESLTEPRIVL